MISSWKGIASFRVFLEGQSERMPYTAVTVEFSRTANFRQHVKTQHKNDAEPLGDLHASKMKSHHVHLDQGMNDVFKRTYFNPDLQGALYNQKLQRFLAMKQGNRIGCSFRD